MDYVIAFLFGAGFLAMMVWLIYDRHLQWEQKKMLGFLREVPD